MFSLWGSSYITFHYLSKIYTNPDFGKFIKIFNDGNTPTEVTYKFVRNVITTHLDPIVQPDLTSESNINLFKNENLSNLEKSKIIVGKIIKKQLHNINPAIIFPNLVIMVPEKEIKEKVLEFTIDQLNCIPDLANATCPRDVYRIIVNHIATNITGIFGLMSHLIKIPINENDFLTQCCSVLGTFNNYYEYKGILDQDNDSSSSDNDNDNDNDDNDPPPRELKRGRANEGLPTPQSEDTKKPKN